LVTAFATSSAWHDKVDLKVYHLDQDPLPARKYGAITGATVIINQGNKITHISTDALKQAFEQAFAEMNK
jgi:hypothetical protein